MSDELPDRLLLADGRTGWFAFAPDGSRRDDREQPRRAPPGRSVIRLMGEHSVHVPLWSDEDGQMFSEPGQLVEEFGVSSYLEAWVSTWETQAGQPEHDAEGARLVRRLNEELDNYLPVRLRALAPFPLGGFPDGTSEGPTRGKRGPNGAQIQVSRRVCLVGGTDARAGAATSYESPVTALRTYDVPDQHRAL